MEQVPLVGSAVTLAPAGSVPAFAEGRILTPELLYWVSPFRHTRPRRLQHSEASSSLPNVDPVPGDWLGHPFHFLLFELFDNLFFFFYLCFNHLIARENEA